MKPEEQLTIRERWNERKDKLQKIKQITLYAGIVLAVLSVILQLVTAVLFWKGIEVDREQRATLILYAIVTAMFGVATVLSLALFGRALGKSDPEFAELIVKLHATKTKASKPQSDAAFWVTTTVKNIFTKGLFLAVSTFAMIYLVVEGLADPSIFLQTMTSIVMSVGFGLLGFTGAFESVEKRYMPWVRLMLEDNNINKEEIDRCLNSNTTTETMSIGALLSKSSRINDK